ncbi:hypothetical protein GCM10023144_10980 [Pigmentiphaga soli]|uniref:FAS1-like dehydratase domain-containing protein n=2 Tax=Pigmentiphaga soli TaxID=1007095 RepID=A0ABP8GMC8_9BURK
MTQAVGRLAARCGELLSSWGPVAVDPIIVERFREAIGWPGDTTSTAVPPTILIHLKEVRVNVHQDERPREVIDDTLVNPVNGGTRYEWMRLIEVGETIKGQVRLHAATMREGRSGPLAIIVTETRYLDARDQVVARMEKTMVYRGAAS